MMFNEDNTLSEDAQVRLKEDIITFAPKILNDLSSSTVESTADVLFDRNPRDHLTESEITFLKNTPLDEMIFEDAQNPAFFVIKNTKTNESIFASNRIPSTGELRASILKEALQEEKNKNSKTTVYDAISNILKNPQYSSLVPYAKNILLNLYASNNPTKRKIITERFNLFIALLIQKSTITDINHLDYNAIYDEAIKNTAPTKKSVKTDPKNTFWSRFKENLVAGSVFRTSENESEDDHFYGHLFAPIITTILLPLQIALYPLIKASEKKSWLARAAGAIGSIVYSLSSALLMIPAIIISEPINIIVAATAAVFKKESLEAAFYADYGRFSENNNSDQGIIYNKGLSVGHFLWNLPSKFFSLFKKKESSKTVMPQSKKEDPLLQKQPATISASRKPPILHAYSKYTPITMVTYHDKPAFSSTYLKGLFEGYKEEGKNEQLLQKTIEAYLLFLHNLAINQQSSDPIDVTAVQNPPNPSRLAFKTKAFREAIIAYKTVNSNVIFTLNGATVTEPEIIARTAETLSLCEKLKKSGQSSQKAYRTL